MRLRTLLAVALACAPLLAAGQDDASRRLAATCAICHGTNGQAGTPSVATLAGMPRGELAQKLRDFRDGKRPATVMHQLAKGYTDPQIDALAAWFSSRTR